jgi:cation diffusion facilitator family transporter
MTTPTATHRCQQSFLGDHHDRNEHRTWLVVALTTVMMVGEIAGGTYYGSMALVADGWHMATHAAALTIAALAYRYARRHAHDPAFSFGTGKVGELAAFASAVTLGVVALLIGWESVQRLIHPLAIGFEQAGLIAVVGLGVNLVSALLLKDNHEHHHGHGQDRDHDHDHDHDHDEDHHHDHDAQDSEHHRDTNLHAAYVHVLADALTSVLAIAGLMAGRFLGWTWMDPLIGIVGALVISQWSIGLMREAGRSLMDAHDNSARIHAIRERLETGLGPDGDRVTDVHLWRVGPGHDALIVALESARPAHPDVYKAKLAGIAQLSHVTIEVNPRRPDAGTLPGIPAAAQR